MAIRRDEFLHPTHARTCGRGGSSPECDTDQSVGVFGLQNPYSEWCLLCAYWQSLRRPKRLIHMEFVRLDHWLSISGPPIWVKS
jgi:hypothetical protein